jgi:pimeloyl-ACP methyl ester carboxylesterase
MHEETVTFEANHQTLCGVFNLSSANPLGAINTLFIHGAGTGSKDRMRYLARGLDAYGTNSFRFDSSGWGESSGKISENSLSKRVTEALAALELMKAKSPVSAPLTIIGSSMGGEVALRLLEHVAVDNRVLFCPGIYHRDAYHVPFDERFSAIIRQEKQLGTLRCFQYT